VQASRPHYDGDENMRRKTILLLAFLSLVGCQRPPAPPSVLILAAASTKDALDEIGGQFQKKHGINVTVSAASSSQLATQIFNSAPGELFLSADEKWADFVRDKGLADKSRRLLGNKLVLITPGDNPATIADPKDLLGERVKRVALAGPMVPAGDYAREALTRLKLLYALEKLNRIVVGDDVRVTLAYVERGEVDAGIVYETDALITDKVKQVFAFPADSHKPIRYPLVLLKAGKGNTAAGKFYDYLGSSDATNVFKKYGFTLLE